MDKTIPLKLRWKKNKHYFQNELYSNEPPHPTIQADMANLSIKSEIKTEDEYTPYTHEPLDLTTTKDFRRGFDENDLILLNSLPDENKYFESNQDPDEGFVSPNFLSYNNELSSYSNLSYNTLDHHSNYVHSQVQHVPVMDIAYQSTGEPCYSSSTSSGDSLEDLYPKVTSPTESVMSVKSSESEGKRRQRQSKAYYDQLTDEQRKERHRKLDNERSRQYRCRRKLIRNHLIESLQKEELRSQELQQKLKQLVEQKMTIINLVCDVTKQKKSSDISLHQLHDILMVK